MQDIASGKTVISYKEEIVEQTKEKRHINR